MRTIKLVIPEDAESGDSLTFQIDGLDMEIPIPEGSQPGDLLEIKLGNSDGGDNGDQEEEDKDKEEVDKNNNNDDNHDNEQDEMSNYNSQQSKRKKTNNDIEISIDSQEHGTTTRNDEETIHLHSTINTSLQISSTIPSSYNHDCCTVSKNVSHLKDNTNPDTDKTNDDIQNENNNNNDCSDGTHAMSWPAGIYLAKYLSSPHFDPHFYLPINSNNNTQHENTITNNTIQIVELGSGLGISGLAIAATISKRLKSSSSFQDGHNSLDIGNSSSKTNTSEQDEKWEKYNNSLFNITLTDLPSSITLLKYNIHQNSHLISSSNRIHISTDALTWGTSSLKYQERHDQNVHLVLASDVLYNSSSIEIYQALSQSIHSLLSPPLSLTQSNNHSNDDVVHNDILHRASSSSSPNNGKLLLAVRWRKPQEERRFFVMMERLGYEFQLISYNDDDDYDALPSLISSTTTTDTSNKISLFRCNCKLGWEEYGNPNNEESNHYFTHTYVTVQGISKPLKDISEADMNSMTNDEYDFFESHYIQLYVGYLKQN